MPGDPFDYFMPRYEAFESKTARQVEELQAEVDDLKQVVAVMAKEDEMTRKSLDRFTNAVIIGSVAVVSAAVSVIIFGPSV